MKKKKENGEKTKKKHDKPVSLYPLKPEEALKEIFKIKPEAKKK